MKAELVNSRELHNCVTRETFTSLIEFADYAEARNCEGFDMYGDGKSWSGDVGFRDALRLARHGWTEETEGAMNIAEDAINQLERDGAISQFKQPVWDVTGSEVDIARYLTSEPECMIDMPLNLTKGSVPTVVLVKSFTFLGAVSANKMREHGRLVVTLVLALEKLGVPVEIWIDRPLSHAHGIPGGLYYQRVLIKGGADYLDAGQLMFAMIHPAMLRKLGFAVAHSACPRERTQEEKDLYGEGAILTETIPADGDAVDFLKAELVKIGLISDDAE